MATEGVDYAFAPLPSATGLFSAGKRFAMRYVGPGSDPKHLHAPERDALWAAGLSVVLLAEGTSSGALGGHSVGVDHATSALAGARALGAPDSTPIYFAIDFDVTPAQWPTVVDYLDGCSDVLGLTRTGMYGPKDSLAWGQRDKAASWFFQAYAPAWSHGSNATPWAQAHVVQYQNHVALAGGTVDLCRAQVDVYGQWTRAGVPIQEPDVDFNDKQKLDAVFNVYPKVTLDVDAVPDGKGTLGSFPVPLTLLLNNILAKVEALSTPEPAPVDLTAIRDIVREELNKTHLSD